MFTPNNSVPNNHDHSVFHQSLKNIFLSHSSKTHDISLSSRIDRFITQPRRMRSSSKRTSASINNNNNSNNAFEQEYTSASSFNNINRSRVASEQDMDQLNNNNNNDNNNDVNSPSALSGSPSSMKTPLIGAAGGDGSYGVGGASNNNNKSSSSPSSNGPGGPFRKWAAFFGRDTDDYVQTASLSFSQKTSLAFNHFLGNWTPSDRRRLVAANPRAELLQESHKNHFPPNVVNNRRYSIFSFWILCLLDQFRFSAFNIYFLALACSQFIPVLQVGMMFTYFAPLAFVVALSMLKEGYDDIKRWQQDHSINSAEYQRLIPGSNGEFETVKSENICVGDIIKIDAGKRIPADLILLHTTEDTGSCFVRTDQLDGETDWKPRHPIKATLKMDASQIAKIHFIAEVEVPHRDIYAFEATYVVGDSKHDAIKIGIDVNSTLWCGCSVAAGTTLGLVTFTGIDTRATLNAERASTKISLMDRELNVISILCFLILFMLSILLVVQQLSIHWLPVSKIFISMFRFQILMSAIIPISLRVNLDIARIWYAIGIVWDKEKLPDVAVRNTNIAEELGRLHYLFSDKTGTLTKNEMHFRTLHLDDNFALEDTEVPDIKTALDMYFTHQREEKQNFSDMMNNSSTTNEGTSPKTPKDSSSSRNSPPNNNNSNIPPPNKKKNNSPLASQTLQSPQMMQQQQQKHHHSHIVGYNKKQSMMIGKAILSLGLCHQVTPVIDQDKPDEFTYQAASPDEIAMVNFAALCGVQLLKRETCRREDEETGDTIEGEVTLRIRLEDAPSPARTPSAIAAGSDAATAQPMHARQNSYRNDEHLMEDDSSSFLLKYDVLRAFPFSSERKSMSIVIRNKETRQIQFLMKGADVKMQECIVKNDATSWLEDRCMELAKTGRRTLVFAARDLSLEEYRSFVHDLNTASASPMNRAEEVDKVMTAIETNLSLIGVTGVEDLLQDNVVSTLEKLGVCGLKCIMLTGDKVETAKCIGRSTRLIRTDLVEMLVAKTEQETDEIIDALCSLYAPDVLKKVNREEAERRKKLKNSGNGDDVMNGNNSPDTEDYISEVGVNNNSRKNFVRMSELSTREGRNDGGGYGGADDNYLLGGDSGNDMNAGADAMMQVAWALVTDGSTLKFCLAGKDHPRQKKFLGLMSKAESVVVARCSPTQKAQVVQATIEYCGPSIRVAAIGDGGNDVSMIRAAHVGLGLEGLEGRQAALAADYSFPKFSHCEWLITWHGRSSYLRTASLAQFIIHRGVVYAIVQAVFSLIFNGSTMSVFNGYLMTLYSSLYTMAPIFALVLNEDSLEKDIEDYPELYRWLLKSRAFNMRSFFQWMWLSFFQGGIMMYLTLKIFSNELFQIVSIAFTTLILTELFFVSTQVNFRILWKQRKLHLLLFFLAELVSVLVYFASVFVLPDTFDVKFFFSMDFWRNVGIIVGASIVPVALLIFLESCVRQYLKNRRMTH